MFVYLAENKTTRKVYVGQTCQSLEERKYMHVYDSKGGSALIFHKALRKYGIESFEWKQIDAACSKEELDEKEKYWIKFYKSTDRSFGYNQTEGGTGGAQRDPAVLEKMSRNRKGIPAWNRGIPRTEEEKLAISESHKGQVAWNKGIPMSEEQKQLLGSRMKGKPSPWKGHHPTEETRRRMKENHADLSGENHPLYGKHHTDETRKRISESLKGFKHSEEAKRRMGESHIGSKRSEETKRKMSEANRRRWEKYRQEKAECAA